jgi:hypothetical protein
VLSANSQTCPKSEVCGQLEIPFAKRVGKGVPAHSQGCDGFGLVPIETRRQRVPGAKEVRQRMRLTGPNAGSSAYGSADQLMMAVRATRYASPV